VLHRHCGSWLASEGCLNNSALFTDRIHRPAQPDKAAYENSHTSSTAQALVGGDLRAVVADQGDANSFPWAASVLVDFCWPLSIGVHALNIGIFTSDQYRTVAADPTGLPRLALGGDLV